MFMVAMVHGPFGFRFGFSALFRNSEFEFRKRNREDNLDIERVETFAGRAASVSSRPCYISVGR
jgi:hypothetical protein